ncbi:uncharacterized protein LOC134282441 [Saccostrea cucullata]|uniref:uncharacterized protein LOC134282441 n=1 Tax=Saccostrea cuccullata TaxID=36930 RepID=UPI002ED45EDD
MGDVPGPSTAPYFIQGRATENFSRLCQLIMTIFSDLFRDILSRYIKPADLRSELDKNRSILEKIMNHQQKELVYPSSGPGALTSKDLDISVIYIILRNISKLEKHKAGWGKHPKKDDKSVSAYIEMIRIKRNSVIGHLKTGKVDDKDFQCHWEKTEEAIIAIEKNLTGGDMYKRGVKQLLSCDLNPTRSNLYIWKCKTCLWELIKTICSDLFRDILSRYIKPADLRSELDKNRSILEKFMNPQQKELVYPSSGPGALISKDLDISVIYIILRKICKLEKHRAGWGKHPKKDDKSVSAYIERIRFQKYSIIRHSRLVKVDDKDFQYHWEKIGEVIIAIEKHFTGGDMYERGHPLHLETPITGHQALPLPRLGLGMPDGLASLKN